MEKRKLSSGPNTIINRGYYVEHTPEFREEIVKSAFKIGVSQTAGLYKVTEKFVYKWKRRYLAGQGFNNQGKNPPLTNKEKTKIVKVAQTHNIYNPHRLKTEFSISASPETIQRILLESNFPLPKPFLLFYKCTNCPSNPNVIQLYHGRLLKPPCPNCSQPLKYITRYQLPFYNPSIEDYYLSKGLLRPITDSEFNHKIQPYLNFDSDLIALFIIHSKPQKKYKFHIIKTFHNDIPITFCGNKYGFDRPHKIISTHEGSITVEKICRTCQARALKPYHRKKHLRPIYTFSQKTKLQEDLEIMLDSFFYKSVSAVCALHKINRSTFYEITNRNQEIYTVLKQSFQKGGNYA